MSTSFWNYFYNIPRKQAKNEDDLLAELFYYPIYSHDILPKIFAVFLANFVDVKLLSVHHLFSSRGIIFLFQPSHQVMEWSLFTPPPKPECLEQIFLIRFYFLCTFYNAQIYLTHFKAQFLRALIPWFGLYNKES